MSGGGCTCNLSKTNGCAMSCAGYGGPRCQVLHLRAAGAESPGEWRWRHAGAGRAATCSLRWILSAIDGHKPNTSMLQRVTGLPCKPSAVLRCTLLIPLWQPRHDPAQQFGVSLLFAPQVRPDFTEAAFARSPFGKSLRDHLLSRYRNAFAAIVLTQLQIKGWQKGMQACARGVRMQRL